MRMDIRHVRYFVAVAEELDFMRVAERMHMAQAPLSTQIRALEEEIGAQLLLRDKRRVLFTPAGQELFDLPSGLDHLPTCSSLMLSLETSPRRSQRPRLQHLCVSSTTGESETWTCRLGLTARHADCIAAGFENQNRKEAGGVTTVPPSPFRTGREEPFGRVLRRSSAFA